MRAFAAGLGAVLLAGCGGTRGGKWRGKPALGQGRWLLIRLSDLHALEVES